MNPNWALHHCAKLLKNGVEVSYSIENVLRKTGTWQLVIRRETTLEDIENSVILEETGETIWETILEITHCPFCGMYLLEDGHEKYGDVGYFVHYDYSEWKVKRK
jgi:hypothetical protein